MVVVADECLHEIPEKFPANYCAKCKKRLCKATHPARGIRCMELAGHGRKEQKPHFNRYDPHEETW